jgi:hypothetical protein
MIRHKQNLNGIKTNQELFDLNLPGSYKEVTAR